MTKRNLGGGFGKKDGVRVLLLTGDAQGARHGVTLHPPVPDDDRSTQRRRSTWPTTPDRATACGQSERIS